MNKEKIGVGSEDCASRWMTFKLLGVLLSPPCMSSWRLKRKTCSIWTKDGTGVGRRPLIFPVNCRHIGSEPNLRAQGQSTRLRSVLCRTECRRGNCRNLSFKWKITATLLRPYTARKVLHAIPWTERGQHRLTCLLKAVRTSQSLPQSLIGRMKIPQRPSRTLLYASWMHLSRTEHRAHQRPSQHLPRGWEPRSSSWTRILNCSWQSMQWMRQGRKKVKSGT